MTKKLTSRKLWITILYAVLGLVNSKYGMNLPMTEIGAVAGSYIIGESAIDLVNKKEGGGF
jgi:hypothetical protein